MLPILEPNELLMNVVLIETETKARNSKERKGVIPMQGWLLEPTLKIFQYKKV